VTVSYTVGHIPGEYRDALRPVALAYRRARRKALAEGIHVREAEDMALAAAHEEFVRQRPEATTWSKAQISGHVMPLIAAAINIDTKWFWDGPDA